MLYFWINLLCNADLCSLSYLSKPCRRGPPVSSSVLSCHMSTVLTGPLFRTWSGSMITTSKLTARMKIHELGQESRRYTPHTFILCSTLIYIEASHNCLLSSTHVPLYQSQNIDSPSVAYRGQTFTLGCVPVYIWLLVASCSPIFCSKLTWMTSASSSSLETNVNCRTRWRSENHVNEEQVILN